MTQLLLTAFFETLIMVGVSSLLALIGGILLGVLLAFYAPNGLSPRPFAYQILSLSVNAVRSIPYIILTVLMIPLTRILVGTSIGTWAAVVPLAIAGLLLIARSVEDALRAVPQGFVEIGLSCGARRWQIVRKILLPEALPQIVSAATLVVINIIGFSAMAGAVGGGGLGDLAIRYGYQRYDINLLLAIVLILIVMVQLVQMAGDMIVRRMRES